MLLYHLQWDVWVSQPQGTCKMQVSIYSSDDVGTFIVECNRLNGDHEPFNCCYYTIQMAFQTQPNLRHVSSVTRDSFISIGQIPCQEYLSDEDTKKALQPIVQLATSTYIEDQIEAARMLCFFSHDETLQQSLCDGQCMRALLQLASPEAPILARQYSFMALANLTTLHGPCQEALLETELLLLLLQNACDGSYETAELRRESARGIANLACRLSARIASKVGEDMLQAWTTTVDGLTDDRLRLHAKQAKEYFQRSIRC